MAMSEETRNRIKTLIGENRLVLFMKGSRQQPQCGFSARTVEVLDAILPDYHTVDVLSDPEIREGIKEFSNWPTIPQLYIEEEFIGGCDIIQELFTSGELHERLGLEAAKIIAPEIQISDRALQVLEEASSQAGHKNLVMKIDANFQHSLGFSPEGTGAISTEVQGFTFHFDPVSAQRANGLSLDFQPGPQGQQLVIQNPNEPNPVQSLTPQELKAKQEANEEFYLWDIRTPEEREQACITGSRLVDQEVAQEIERLPKDAPMVFYCHHGNRSRNAAAHFRSLGFTNLYNLEGGIDAWSQEVDTSVPRY